MRVSLSGHFVFKLDAGGARMSDDWLARRFAQFSSKKEEEQFAHRAALDSYDALFDVLMNRVAVDIEKVQRKLRSKWLRETLRSQNR
jgi:hypothetical protein